MGKPVALVTGAGGEMGRLLVPALVARDCDVVAMDLGDVPPELARDCLATAKGDLLDGALMRELVGDHRPRAIFHLAALLSAQAEREPDKAHRVNVEGTLQLFQICREITSGDDRPIRFLFPSSIAVYGLPDADTKASAGALRETEWTVPTGVYGINKLYCELLGSYLARRHGGRRPALDFRAIRFPGLISAETLPSGGTTDYAPEMLHAAARGEAYSCFVGPHTKLPFMTMPDGVAALIALAWADADALSTRVYNIQGFAATAEELRRATRDVFPDAAIDFAPVEAKQELVDTWPAALDDALARRDWGLAPEHGLAEAVEEYLAPALRERYAKAR